MSVKGDWWWTLRFREVDVEVDERGSSRKVEGVSLNGLAGQLELGDLHSNDDFEIGRFEQMPSQRCPSS